MILDSPQLSVINASVFDWWYFDSVSAQDPRETVTVTFFTSTASAFPWLPVEESSVLIAYLWISFANGTIVEEYVPATAAIIDQAMHGDLSSSGNWSSTGFSWFSSGQNLSQYEIVVSSGKLQIDGRLTLTSVSVTHVNPTMCFFEKVESQREAGCLMEKRVKAKSRTVVADPLLEAATSPALWNQPKYQHIGSCPPHRMGCSYPRCHRERGHDREGFSSSFSGFGLS